MDISYMPKIEDGYHLLVVAWEYLSGWAEAWPLKQGTSEKVADFFYEEVICWFGTPESVVVDGGAEKKKSTKLLLKRYNIRKITGTPYHAAANRVIERGHRPIADALSKLTACSDKPKEMWITHLLAVLWADRITVWRTTRYSPFRLMFGQDAVLPIELENLTCNTANWIQGIDDMASLIAARARQLERRPEDIDVAIQNLKESRDANKRYFDQAANLRAEDLQIGDLALVHETKIEQSHRAKLDARWRGPYRVTEIAQSLATYRLAELDWAELVGWIDGSRLKKFFTRNEGVHGTREISTPSSAQAKESEEFEEFEVEAVAGRKSIEGRWMYLIKWKDWEKRSWVRAEDMAGSQELMDKWNAAHPVPADHPSKQWWESRMEEEAGGEGRRSIVWTMTKRVEDTESTQLHEIARWRGKKYSYWLSCTHVTPKIHTILS
jgi:hypothetical protein